MHFSQYAYHCTAMPTSQFTLAIDKYIDNHYHLHYYHVRYDSMIVCVCKNINAKTIANALDKVPPTLTAVLAETGAGSCCQSCHDEITDMISAHVNNTKSSNHHHSPTIVPSHQEQAKNEMITILN